jgi:hypothetical protein
MTGGPRLRPLALALAIAAAVGWGCGSGNQFTAEELVAEVNRHGGELALGEPLDASGEGPEIHSLTFTGAAPTPEDAHAGGSLVITEDDDDALAEYRRCEGSASLICFRAANAVMIFEGAVQPADLARLAEALQAMGSE